MPTLTQVSISFPVVSYWKEMCKCLSHLGKVCDGSLLLECNNPNTTPQIVLSARVQESILVDFLSNDSLFTSIDVVLNDQIEASSHKKLSWVEFKRRLDAHDIHIQRVDHVGVNLVSSHGIHEVIIRIRQEISKHCLYYTYPGLADHLAWDFIIPGHVDEIVGNKVVNYEISRYPKVELVSFDASEIPLVQIDLVQTHRVSALTRYFPEGLYDDTSDTLWIYLETGHGYDMCLVLRDDGEDWMKVLSGQRYNP